MALQVWLPLNGNLNNQGLANVTVSNSGATVNSAGKIGSCYAFDGSDDYIAVSGQQLFDCFKGGDTQFSLCMWIYNGESSGARGVLFGDHGTTGAVSINIELNGNAYNNSIRFYWTANPDWAASNSILTPNTWSHLTITYSGTDVKVYVNGILKDTRTGTLAAKSKTSGMFMLGRDYRTGETALNGRLNDFRIYDHCLSPKEVKEISKGLVLHYKLDASSLKGSGNLINGLSGGGQCTISGNTVSVSGNNSDTYFYIKTTQSLTSGKTYKISCIGSFADGKYYYFPIGGQSNTGPGQLVVKNGYCSMVFVANNAIANAGTTIILDDTTRSPGAGTISNIMLEEVVGISDCSGYGRNGTISGQSVSINNISPRYNYNLLATNTSNWSVITNSGFSLPDGPTTMCFWSKPTVSATENTSRVQIDFGYFQYFTYVNYPYLIHNTDYKYKYVNYWSDGNWHFVTGVYDGTNLSIYIDGANVSPSTTTTTRSYQSDLIIRLMGNNFSDFRIYATALSADDIKDLYQTSAAIHNTGNIEAFEFVETNTASRELNPWPIIRRSGSGDYTTLEDGSIQFSTVVWWASDYIPISPTGKTYYYDIEFSNESGNLFYIGFEKYDSNKASGSNEECQYLVGSTQQHTRNRITGTINLSTANGNTAAYTRLRILNNWSNTSGKGTIHHISLKEVTTKTTSDIKKNGVFEGDAFIESKDASISHTGNVVCNQIIEI